MMRPVIGLNMSLQEMDDPFRAKASCLLKYIDAIAGAGGIPLLVPPYSKRSMLEQALSCMQGFCFIGGPDYDPSHYGGHAQPSSDLMDPRRHRFDLWLAEALLKRTRKPVLGVCGGHQLVALALGGALVQDLKSEWHAGVGAPACGRPRGQAPTLPHAGDERQGTPQEGNAFRHEVTLAPGSHIARIIGSATVAANSFHHQAVRPERLGKGLVATAWAPDGVVEAIEPVRGTRFLLGVQWHPERQTDEPAHRAIFEALVAAAGKQR
ncbi:MAG: gamma-glutamyl-gamma-aminobutyrate hydrolase family protein [Planctomycetota bacterium]|nr:gamma-glutamyl-gamma-aminobutyrate hydrolase family protein [Planctomycetota bacterium]